MRRRYSHNRNNSLLANFANILGPIFGFAKDSIIVVFKLSPDDDQDFSDFIWEKLGAIALLTVCIVIFAAILLGIYFEFMRITMR